MLKRRVDMATTSTLLIPLQPVYLLPNRLNYLTNGRIIVHECQKIE